VSGRRAKPRIVATPETCWGEPRIDGTRVTVDAIASTFRAGDDVLTIAEWFDLSAAQVEECLRFALMTKRQREKYLAGLSPFKRSAPWSL